MSKTYLRNDLGDFQTPLALVEHILDCPELSRKTWPRILEPTCGQGNFVRILCSRPNPPNEIHAIEIQHQYVQQVQALSGPITVHENNIFNMNVGTDLDWHTDGPLLIIGNPPWINNAALSSLDSQNHPEKSNFKQLQGFDAITGSSNFDITEYILLKLIRELADNEPTIAVLCKTSVARNILQFAPQAHLPIATSVIRRFDAKQWFNVAVDACLFILELRINHYNPITLVYSDLKTTLPAQRIEQKQGQLIADSLAYQKLVFLDGKSTLSWRQGLKHDAVPVMELLPLSDKQWKNKAGQLVIVEPEHVYPLLKSSDLARGTMDNPRKAIIVTQRRLTDDTSQLITTSPLLWQYLIAHESTFNKRKSTIYSGKPRFSIFGIGDYAFSRYKVAIAGMYKTPRFQAVGPIQSRPVMCDDTCYFIPCESAEQAAFLTALLNSPACLEFLNAIMFKDSKRPVTKKLLQRINLQNLLTYVTPDVVLRDAALILARLNNNEPVTDIQWPSLLETFLVEQSNKKQTSTQLDLWI